MYQHQNEDDVRVDARKFIEIWQTSTSVAEVAAKTRSKKGACKVRAYRYRQRGVPLKEFPPVEIEPINWDELADYAELVEVQFDMAKAGQADCAQVAAPEG